MQGLKTSLRSARTRTLMRRHNYNIACSADVCSVFIQTRPLQPVLLNTKNRAFNTERSINTAVLRIAIENDHGLDMSRGPTQSRLRFFEPMRYNR